MLDARDLESEHSTISDRVMSVIREQFREAEQLFEMPTETLVTIPLERIHSTWRRASRTILPTEGSPSAATLYFMVMCRWIRCTSELNPEDADRRREDYRLWEPSDIAERIRETIPIEFIDDVGVIPQISTASAMKMREPVASRKWTGKEVGAPELADDSDEKLRSNRNETTSLLQLVEKGLSIEESRIVHAKQREEKRRENMDIERARFVPIETWTLLMVSECIAAIVGSWTEFTTALPPQRTDEVRQFLHLLMHRACLLCSRTDTDLVLDDDRLAETTEMAAPITDTESEEWILVEEIVPNAHFSSVRTPLHRMLTDFEAFFWEAFEQLHISESSMPMTVAPWKVRSLKGIVEMGIPESVLPLIERTYYDTEFDDRVGPGELETYIRQASMATLLDSRSIIGFTRPHVTSLGSVCEMETATDPTKPSAQMLLIRRRFISNSEELAVHRIPSVFAQAGRPMRTTKKGDWWTGDMREVPFEGEISDAKVENLRLVYAWGRLHLSDGLRFFNAAIHTEEDYTLASVALLMTLRGWKIPRTDVSPEHTGEGKGKAKRRRAC